MTQNLFALGVGLALVATSAFADHNDPNVRNSIRREAYQLNQVVQYSAIHYSVKQAVAQLGNEVEAFSSCNVSSFEPESLREIEIGTLEHPVGSCGYVADRVRRTWQETERYLYDTEYDYPQIHQQYRRTQRAIAELGLGGGGETDPLPPPVSGRDWFADGSLDGYRFSIQARSNQDIHRKCVNFAYRNRLGYVRSVQVNGYSTTYWNAVSAEQACSFVSQNARYRY